MIVAVACPEAAALSVTFFSSRSSSAIEVDTIGVELAVLGTRRPPLDVLLGKDVEHHTCARDPAWNASLLARQLTSQFNGLSGEAN
jgi:hypothetical protein